MNVEAERAADGASSSPAIAQEQRNATRIVVLMGGASSEREVSLRTGAAVVRALGAPPRAGDSRTCAPVVDAVEIEASGRWRVDGRSMHASEGLLAIPRDAVFFLATHGGAGEDGTLQGLLASDGRVHTGSGVRASALCMNKHATRLVLRETGIPIAAGRCIDAREWREHRREIFVEIRSLGTEGWVVKPNHGGSSVATSVVTSEHDLPAAIETVLATGDRALVEARVVGVEVTCGVLGNCDEDPRALPLVEIIPHSGRFFDYQEKYDAHGAEEVCPPRHLDEATCRRVQDLARRAHIAAGCDGYSRIDFIVPLRAGGPPSAGGPALAAAERESGERSSDVAPVVLEINTLPGMTERSLLPRAALAVGLEMPQLCMQIVRSALALRSGRSAGGIVK